MANVIELPKPSDVWQFTVEVVRRPDGVHAARLVDARTSLIESGGMEPHEKLHEIANLLEAAIGPMRADASAIMALHDRTIKALKDWVEGPTK